MDDAPASTETGGVGEASEPQATVADGTVERIEALERMVHALLEDVADLRAPDEHDAPAVNDMVRAATWRLDRRLGAVDEAVRNHDRALDRVAASSPSERRLMAVERALAELGRAHAGLRRDVAELATASSTARVV